MQKTSSLYQAEVQKSFAAQGYIRITFGVTDTDAATTCAPPETTTGVFFSRPESLLLEEGAPKATYATFELGRMRVDGSQLIAPSPTQVAAGEIVKAEGFVSAALAGADGAFAENDVPQVILRFSKKHTVPGLTFTFDATCADWPTQMHLIAYRDGASFFEADYAPDAAVYTTPDAIERFDELMFRFSRMEKPYRRLRLQQVMFGFGLVLDNHLVQESHQIMDVDPIGRRLPTNTFEFDIININTITGTGDQYLYDPDNAAGIYKYISEQNPVKVEYGQLLPDGMTWSDVANNTWGELELNGWQELYDGGVTEWVPGGRYYLTGQPTVDGLTASFKAQDALTGLDDTYYKGVYVPAGRDLYHLALDVLQDSGLSPLQGNEPPWVLWEGLEAFSTTAPLPLKKHKELLQLIAHAACCVLYTDREGYIRIEPASAEQDNYKLDFNTMYSRPKVSQIPTLWAVECPAYVYAPQTDASELHKGSYVIDGTLSLHLTFTQACEVAVQVAGATIEAQALYAGAADLQLRGNGTAEVIVTGRKLETSTRTVTAAVEKPDENGSVETLDNPLLTDPSHALVVAEWVRDWLLQRNTYEFEYRGSPEIDPGDQIWLETPFSPFVAPARVLRSELSFTGALSGKMTAKRMVNQ